MRILIVLLLCSLPLSAWSDDQITTLAAATNSAHQIKDYVHMEQDVEKLLRFLPDHPRIWYLFAVAKLGHGDRDGALQALRHIAEMGVYIDIRSDPELSPLRAMPEFSALEKRFSLALKPVGSATVAFQLKEPDFIPEGLAYDTLSGDFFVGSVHLRKVVRVHNGVPYNFADGDSGLWSVLGIKPDSAHRVLWVVTSALPQMEGYDDSLRDRSALYAFDLMSGQRLAVYKPSDNGPHAFNDLTIATDGGVYVADGEGGVYVLAPGTKTLQPLIPKGALRSSQGLALSADGRLLYIADYSRGLFAYDLTSTQLTHLTAPADINTTGLDGLARHGSDLIATQNGINPQRVLRLSLTQSGLAIATGSVIEANDPLVPEPTLEDIVGDTLYVVANSQWSRFDEKGVLAPASRLEVPRIVKLSLPRSDQH